MATNPENKVLEIIYSHQFRHTLHYRLQYNIFRSSHSNPHLKIQNFSSVFKNIIAIYYKSFVQL